MKTLNTAKQKIQKFKKGTTVQSAEEIVSDTPTRRERENKRAHL
jgi:hypothetical protein